MADNLIGSDLGAARAADLGDEGSWRYAISPCAPKWQLCKS
jgi:hypothetical protein